jgi:hypothetical protein
MTEAEVELILQRAKEKSASDLARLPLVGQPAKPAFQTVDKTIANGVLFFFAPCGTTEDKSFFRPFWATAKLDLHPSLDFLPVLLQKLVLELLQQGFRSADEIAGRERRNSRFSSLTISRSITETGFAFPYLASMAATWKGQNKREAGAVEN